MRLRLRKRKDAEEEPRDTAARRTAKEERRSPIRLIIGALVIGLLVLASAVYAFSYSTKVRMTVAGKYRRQVADLRLSYLGIHSVSVPTPGVIRVPPGFYRLQEKLPRDDVRISTPLCVVSPKLGKWITIGPGDTFRLRVSVVKCPRGKK
jgi:hypothetical protein